MFYRRKSRPFTLIELLLCFALLAIFGSMAAIQGFQSLKVFRYQQSVKRLQEELTFVKHLSLSSKVDIHFELFWDQKILTGRYFLDDTDQLLDPLLRKKRTFNEIHLVTINGEPLTHPIVITFSPNARAQTIQIALALSASSETNCFTIL